MIGVKCKCEIEMNIVTQTPTNLSQVLRLRRRKELRRQRNLLLDGMEGFAIHAPESMPPSTNSAPATATRPCAALGDGGLPLAGTDRSVHVAVAGS